MTDTSFIDTQNSEHKPARRRLFQPDPKFRSEAWRAGKIELHRRDLDIIEAVARHRFLNSEQICRLFACDCPLGNKLAVRGGRPAMIQVKQHRPRCSCTCLVGDRKGEHATECPALFKNDKHLVGRLRELFHAGYLGRPIAQLQLRIKNGIAAGSAPMVYCVTNAGLALLGEPRRLLIGLGKATGFPNFKEGTRIFVEHTLSIADVSTGVDRAMRGRKELARISESVLAAGMSNKRRTTAHPWGLSAEYKAQVLTAVCDIVFGIRDLASSKQFNFMVEVDRGHMPIERHDLTQTSIKRKLIAYARAFENNEHVSSFGWRNFRVLVLTTSEQRVQSCVAAARAGFGKAPVSRIFLFGTLDAADDLLNYEFATIDGKRAKLLD